MPSTLRLSQPEDQKPPADSPADGTAGGHASPLAQGVSESGVLLLDGTPWPERTWPVWNFRPGDQLSFADGSGLCYEVAASKAGARGMWQLDLRDLAAPDEPVLELNLPRHVLACGHRMVRALTADCSFRRCPSTTQLSVEVGAVGQARIKVFICGSH